MCYWVIEKEALWPMHSMKFGIMSIVSKISAA